MEPTYQSNNTKKPMIKKLTKVIIVLLVVVLSAALVYYYRELKQIRNNPDIISQEETARIVSKVARLYALPGDEEPAIATVIDKEQLGDQPFFATAQNEDKILIYTKAKLAIIYRESEDKIISVGPIAINQDNKANDSSTSDTPSSGTDTSTEN